MILRLHLVLWRPEGLYLLELHLMMRRFAFLLDGLWLFWRQEQLDALNTASRQDGSVVLLYQDEAKAWRLRAETVTLFYCGAKLACRRENGPR